jgi:hypothetical protein
MRMKRSVVLEADHSSLTIRRPAEGVVLIVITGSDVGELGDAPFRELADDVSAGRPFRLFIDARATQGATVDVSNSWAQWLRGHRSQLEEIHMLVGSRLVQVTAEFVRRFSELGGVMKIHTSGEAFDAVLATAVLSELSPSAPE